MEFSQWMSPSDVPQSLVDAYPMIQSMKNEIASIDSQIANLQNQITPIEANNIKLQAMADDLSAQEPIPVAVSPSLPASTLPTIASPVLEQVPTQETQMAGMSPWILILLAGVGVTMIFGRKKGRGIKGK